MYKVIYFKTPTTKVNVSRFFKILQGDKFSLNVNLLGSNHFNKIEISHDFDLNRRFVSSSRCPWIFNPQKIPSVVCFDYYYDMKKLYIQV